MNAPVAVHGVLLCAEDVGQHPRRENGAHCVVLVANWQYRSDCCHRPAPPRSGPLAKAQSAGSCRGARSSFGAGLEIYFGEN